MKRPSFQFYPGDWLHDTALRTISISARGLWIDMICIMHQSEPYGHLKVNHKVILTSNLARMTGLTLSEAEGYLKELEDAGVFSKIEDGTIVSRRMIRDEIVRKSRADGGKLGGNPRLTLEVKQKPTPSSSSSSSSSIIENIKRFAKEFYKRKETTPWSKGEINKLKEISKRPEVEKELEEIKKFYITYQFPRHDVQTFLNCWQKEIDKARREKPEASEKWPVLEQNEPMMAGPLVSEEQLAEAQNLFSKIMDKTNTNEK